MPGRLTQRPYRDDADYLRMRRFLQDGWATLGIDGGLFHVGDLTWMLFQHVREIVLPEERVRLWEGPDGKLAAFALYHPKWGTADLQIDPAIDGAEGWSALVGEMLDFIDERHTANANGKPVVTLLPAIDTRLIAEMESRGFTRDPDSDMRFHRRALADELPSAPLPDGFVVRAVRESELEERVAIHREVWSPSKVTVESYRHLRAAPGYDPELDIVAVAPDGTIAAYAICWHDEVNGNGEFEPVGAREGFRGRGLTKAVLFEAMRRLQARGCEQVYVYTEEVRAPAVALYRSAGFDLIYYLLAYSGPYQGESS